MKYRSSYKILTLMAIILITVNLAACNGSTTTESVTEAKTSVRYQMGWTHEYSAAGFYAADKNGHFSEQNLDVTLIEGGFGEQGYIDPLTNLMNEEAEFTSISATRLLQARAEGQPVVAIAATLQRSPLVLMSRTEKNIIRPSDLRGKRVTVSDGGARALYEALLGAQGIDLAEVETISRTDFGIDPLLNDEVDVLAGWIINEGILMEEAGLEPNFIIPSDYGIDAYNSLIVTTEKMITEQPDIVEGFLQAVILGHQDVVDNPEQAIDLILTYDDSLIRADQQPRLQAMIPLIKPAGSLIGDMKPEIWALSHQILFEHGVLNQPVDVEAIYTLTFIESVHATLASR